MSKQEMPQNEVRANFTEVINQAVYNGQSTVITRRGKATAAIVPLGHDDARVNDLLAELAAAKATIQRVHEVAQAHYDDLDTNLFNLGRADAYDRVKSALDPASAATWGVSEDLDEER